MKKFNLVITNKLLGTIKTLQVKSDNAMWTEFRKVRDLLTDEMMAAGVHATATTEDGILYKDITYHRNSKGKIEMPNAVKETCRRQLDKAKAAAKKEEERKARKREADRRYRARLKARKEAEKAMANQAEVTTAQTEATIQNA